MKAGFMVMANIKEITDIQIEWSAVFGSIMKQDFQVCLWP
jgi:hypothetical protein